MPTCGGTHATGAAGGQAARPAKALSLSWQRVRKDPPRGHAVVLPLRGAQLPRGATHGAPQPHAVPAAQHIHSTAQDASCLRAYFLLMLTRFAQPECNAARVGNPGHNGDPLAQP